MKQKAGLWIPVASLVITAGLYSAYCLIGSQSGSICNAFLNIRSLPIQFLIINTLAFAFTLIAAVMGFFEFKEAGKVSRITFIAALPISILAMVVALYAATWNCVGFTGLTF